MIKLLSSKIETEIANHFDEHFDITEPKEDFEAEFIFDGAEITVPYSLKHELVSYANDEISATKNCISYCTEDKEHFQIKRCCHNPKKRTLQQEIDSIIEHEERKQDENRKSSEAIEAHNEYLHLNNR